MTKRALLRETYACGQCGAVVDVEAKGRRWSAAAGEWLCSPCFEAETPSATEIDAKLDAFARRNRGSP